MKNLLLHLFLTCLLAMGILPMKAQAPEITCPADVTVSCDDDTTPSFTGSATATDDLPGVMISFIDASTQDGGGASGDPVWINEIHYDNVGSDLNEGVEIAGLAGTDLSTYTVILYNGNNGTVYNTEVLSGTIPDEGSGYGAVFFAIAGLQNGAPDGIALDDGSTVLQFLSYEGSFMAMNGPASGMTSTDIGVSETSATTAEESLQLTGTGSQYSDFTWTGPSASSAGSINAGQTFESAPLTIGYYNYTITRTWIATDASGNEDQCIQTIVVVDITDPEIYCPADLTLNCEDDTSPSIVATAIDNCSAVEIGYSDVSTQSTGGPSGDPVWINEIHYDNTGGDLGEGVEIAGVAGTDMNVYTLTAYNGNGGASYNSVSLSGIIPDEGSGFGALFFSLTGLQNGAPDGVALSGPTSQFLSYEGSFTASNGPASGMTSTDIGVSETSGTPVGQSLQLSGTGSQYSDFTWAGPTATSLGSINSGQTMEGVSSASEYNYTITRTWTASDVSGNSTSCDQTITIEDVTDPTIDTEASNISVACDGSGNATQLQDWLASHGGTGTASDNCSGIVWSHTEPVLSDGCGATGSAEVTFTATDASNNSAATTATFTIEDITAPTITCPSDISVDTNLDACNAVVTYTVDHSDDCGTTTIQQTAGLASGQEFPIGTTTNTFIVTDECENSIICSFEVTVSDSQAPEALCQDATVQLNDLGIGTLTTAMVDNGSNDACGIANLSLDNTAFTCADIGSEPVALNELFISEYIEGGGFNKCIEIYNGTGVTVDLAADGYNLQLYVNGAASAGTTINLAGSVAAGDVYVVCEDSANPEFLAETDQQANNLSFNGDDAVVLRKGATIIDVIGQIGTDPGSEWGSGITTTQDHTLRRKASIITGDTDGSDAFDPSLEWDGFLKDVSDGLGSHSTDSGGGNTVTLTVTDNNGLSSTCTATVTVEDNVNPVITTASADLPVECDGSGNISELNAWLANNGGAEASDACGFTWSNNFSALSDDCGETGSVTVTFIATDASNNSASTTATFTIEDTIAPSIDVIASDQMVECDGAGNAAQFAAWLASNGNTGAASDECGGVVWTHNSAGLSDLCAATGTETVTFTATDDCDNSSTTTATFTIEDTNSPTIDAIASNQTVECDGAGNTAQFAAWLASNGNTGAASDGCGAVVWTHNSTGLSDLCAATGSETVTFTATDDCDNSSTTTATFTIEDTTAPDVTCPDDIAECGDAALLGSAVFWTVPTPTDACGAVASLVSDYESGDVFPVGMTTVTYTATDDCGNSTQCTFIVEVYEPLSADAGDCQTHYDANGYAPEAEILNHLAVVAAGGVGPYTYAWSGDGIVTAADQQTISVDPTSDHPTEAIVYTVVVTDATGCTAESSVQVIYENIVCHNNGKVQVCHYPSNNNGVDGNTLCLPPSAVDAHIGVEGHNDVWGDCANALNCNATNPAPIVPGVEPIDMGLANQSATKSLSEALDIQVTPNPFNDYAMITLTSSTDGNAVIDIYDLNGSLVSHLFNADVRRGQVINMEVNGEHLRSNGIYFYRIIIGDQLHTGKLIYTN